VIFNKNACCRRAILRSDYTLAGKPDSSNKYLRKQAVSPR
jgi:hypothetical protein